MPVKLIYSTIASLDGYVADWARRRVQMLIAPVVGGGTRGLPDGVRLDLELLEQRRFDGGVIFLRYGD